MTLDYAFLRASHRHQMVSLTLQHAAVGLALRVSSECKIIKHRQGGAPCSSTRCVGSTGSCITCAMMLCSRCKMETCT
jgi:hypothetical protein